MILVKIDPLTDSRYNECINASLSATIFHTSNWARLLLDSYSFVPECFAVMQEDRIAGVLPFVTTRSIVGTKRYVTLSFSDFCEPLFDETSQFDCAFRELVKKAENAKCKYIEIRGGQRFLGDKDSFDSIYTHDIDLTASEEKSYRSFRNSTQRNIKKAMNEGVTVVHEQSLDALRSFYRLNCITRKKHGIPPQPWKFFDRLHKNIIKENKGFISCAIINNSVIAANVYLFQNKNALYKYGASDPGYQQSRPNNLLMWEGVRRCKEMGCTTINLGRTELHHTGLLQFKRGFGCRESMIHYYRYNVATQSFIKKKSPSPQSEIVHSIVSRFPIAILKFCGSAFYKYIG